MEAYGTGAAFRLCALASNNTEATATEHTLASFHPHRLRISPRICRTYHLPIGALLRPIHKLPATNLRKRHGRNVIQRVIEERIAADPHIALHLVLAQSVHDPAAIEARLVDRGHQHGGAIVRI